MGKQKGRRKQMNNRLSKTDNEHGYEIRSLTLSNFFIQVHVIVGDLYAMTTTTIMMMVMTVIAVKEEDNVDDGDGGGGDDDDSSISDSRQKNDVFYIILSNVLLHFNGNARLGTILVRP